MSEVEKLRALLAEAYAALDEADRKTGEYAELSERMAAALAEPVGDTQESNTPKCEHGVEYGGMGVGCCPRCDQKALILASNETPTAKA